MTEARDGVVLIVDDDESVRETLALALQMEHHPTAAAADGQAALAWLRTHPSPSVILLDLMMPVMDGWQMLEAMREDDRLSRIPVVIITAFGREVGEAGSKPVLRKPVELDDLLRVVDSYRGGLA